MKFLEALLLTVLIAYMLIGCEKNSDQNARTA